MKLRLGAAVLAAALIPLTAATTTGPAHAGVGITPPEVGSCHDYTWDLADDASDPTPEVDCADPHTALTFKVVTFDQAPNWRDLDALGRIVARRCYPAIIETLGGNTKLVKRSAYIIFWFIPTRAERDAGAAWLRCDLVLSGAGRLMDLPEDVVLPGLPLPDSLAKCRKGRSAGYSVTVCTRGHQFRATHSIRYPHSSYPGANAAQRFAVRKCREKLPRAAFYYEWVSRAAWRLGYRHAVCLKQTTA